MEDYIKSLEKELSLFEHGFKGEEKRALADYKANDKNYITDKSNVLMIGDREHDVIGAHENGLDCLGILYGFGSRKEFEEAGADYIRENVEDILQFV